MVERILGLIRKEPDTPEHRRVRRIIELLIRLSTREETWAEDPMRLAERIAAEDELDILLSAYTWKAATGFSDRLRIGFLAVGSSAWEGAAVHTLLDLADDPEKLSRLRLCTGGSSKCKGLFYATRSNNTYCGRACISRHADSDPDKYAARKRKQRENYEETKRRAAAKAAKRI
jgi:hypothetical protein